MPRETNPDEYQGWTNYETWAVALWLDNDEPIYRYWREVADEIREEGPLSIILDGAVIGHREPRFVLADRLRHSIEDGTPDLGASVWSDLLSRAVGRVDWVEIAEYMLIP